ncbi:hypothetical protein HJC22_34870 [Corallococcus exiguus]|uniref:hypothetical protein n=1 Tax=Corallococcus exiguus TaxID=83462 RepID=UPI001470EB8E|nr:hypothetical protein [Corallococcus exiguus]NNC20910.1 hypothetical protein [Corallococcus exiguus]
MMLLKAVVLLSLASAPPAKPAASAGCATTNIETALQRLEAHLKTAVASASKDGALNRSSQQLTRILRQAFAMQVFDAGAR